MWKSSSKTSEISESMEYHSNCTVYEKLAQEGTPDGLLRPGGIALTERALEACSLSPGARVLDLGCGTGVTLRHLVTRRGYRAAGVDPSPLLLEQARANHPSLSVVRGRGEALPWAGGSWEAVLAECSLSLAGDLDGTLSECARVLRAGGHLLVSDVYAREEEFPHDLQAAPVSCCLAGARTRNAWHEAFSSRGFRILLWEDHSRALKEFAAQLILSSPTRQGIPSFLTARGRSGGIPGEETFSWRQLISRARPGYFLCVARKPE